jgi:hypothetical protein
MRCGLGPSTLLLSISTAGNARVKGANRRTISAAPLIGAPLDSLGRLLPILLAPLKILGKFVT